MLRAFTRGVMAAAVGLARRALVNKYGLGKVRGFTLMSLCHSSASWRLRLTLHGGRWWASCKHNVSVLCACWSSHAVLQGHRLCVHLRRSPGKHQDQHLSCPHPSLPNHSHHQLACVCNWWRSCRRTCPATSANSSHHHLEWCLCDCFSGPAARTQGLPTSRSAKGLCTTGGRHMGT